MRWLDLDAGALWPLAPPAGDALDPRQALDPYAAWAAVTGFDGYTANMQFRRPPGDTWASVLVRARKAADIAALAASGKLYVPFSYTRPPPALRKARHFTGRIRLRDLGWLRTRHEIEAWELGLPLAVAPDDDGVPPQQGVIAPTIPYAGRYFAVGGAAAPAGDDRPKLLIGVIDYGLAFLNHAFRRAGGATTRIHSVWDQHERHDKAAPQGWAVASHFGYGRVLPAAAIDAVLAGAPIDEEAAYRRLGYLHQRAQRMRSIKTHAHGTHVLDVAAGCIDPWTRLTDAAGQAALHLVQLPVQTAADASGGSLGVHVLDGLRSVLHAAADDAKVVVVLSQGTHAGPHDGSTLVETAMDELLALRRENFAIVIGAGNSRATADKLPIGSHARATPAAGKPVTLDLLLPAGDASDTFVEFWYDGAAGNELRIEVTPPQGLPAGEAAAPGRLRLLADRQQAVAALVHAGQVPHGGRNMALLALSPTRAGPAGRTAPEGVWHITLHAMGAAGVQVDAWVENDEPLRGSGALWPRFFGPQLSATHTLNALATGRHTLVAGALQRHNRTPAPYSSQGPSLNTRRKMPAVNALAAADENAALRGVRASGVKSGTTWRMSGTSVAAPTLARRLLNHLAAATQPVPRDGWQAVVDKLVQQDPKHLAQAPSPRR